MLNLRISLAAKWLAFQVVGFSLILCLVGVVQYRNIRDASYKDVEDVGEAVSQSFKEMLVQNPELFKTGTLEPVLLRF
ncbi:MAG: hypothetical protein H0T92_00920, partial [Pyrinomonadaceae bacterium]|nr:hypothetical protein [Pyrinomonadaceae bacterium]